MCGIGEGSVWHGGLFAAGSPPACARHRALPAAHHHPRQRCRQVNATRAVAVGGRCSCNHVHHRRPHPSGGGAASPSGSPPAVRPWRGVVGRGGSVRAARQYASSGVCCAPCHFCSGQRIHTHIWPQPQEAVYEAIHDHLTSH